jgi:hypothetical protein
LMRIADRERNVPRSQLALVGNWVSNAGVVIRPRTRWSTLVRRAQEARQRELIQDRQSRERPWHFYCREVSWRGLEIRPLRDSMSLWVEGTALGHCVFKLRHLCTSVTDPSRFFSVRKGDRRLATLELYWVAPQERFLGMDRELGRWEVRDVRLAYNRVPDEGLVRSLTDFAQMYNIWSKRPGRWEKPNARKPQIDRHWRPYAAVSSRTSVISLTGAQS